MIDRDSDSAKLKRAIEATLQAKSPPVPLYQKVVLWAAILLALGGAVVVLVCR